MDSDETRRSLDEACTQLHVLRAADVLQMPGFVRYQDLSVPVMAAHDCGLLLFVSHRWESLDHPDPTGKQHNALVSLVHNICDIADAIAASSSEERLRRVPALNRHGMLQTALLFSRFSAPTSPVAWDESPSARDVLPDHIGVWYDYSCVPQRPRSAKEDAEFERTLLRLPHVLRSRAVNMVALRERGDDYAWRGWCLAETLLTADVLSGRGLAVRAGSLGEVMATIEPTGDGSPVDLLRRRMRLALSLWSDASSGPAEALAAFETVVLLAGADIGSLFKVDDEFAMLPTQRLRRQTGHWIGMMLAALGAAAGEPVDLAVIIKEFARDAGIACAYDSDLLFVMLLMMQEEAADESTIRTFLTECLERQAGGLPIVVTTRFDRRTPLTFQNLNWSFETKG